MVDFFLGGLKGAELLASKGYCIFEKLQKLEKDNYLPYTVCGLTFRSRTSKECGSGLTFTLPSLCTVPLSVTPFIVANVVRSVSCVFK